MKSLVLALVGVFLAQPLLAREKPPAIYTIPLPPRPDFSALDWLIGEWSGYTTERRAPGEIRLLVEFALDKRFMILREELKFTAAKTRPDAHESWMGILSRSRSDATFLLRVFSSTGFITRYRVTVDGPEVRFDPEGGEEPPPGWLFRRVLQRTGEAEFNETVQAAPPHKPFFDYYTARYSRAAQPASPAPSPLP